ncbi:microtubule associated protein 9 L homeolog isoform X2 [Xenopus laevis]|uniref:Microtubule associated protein 9 L homeolog isoform X2 n=1 Tax=Xenopus laevis TaxID=8355 RepID=A0A8J0UL36_XENLA|nr:microtubule associated protein 9 L homeolog isoform X2 [Xenopus laevis]
MKRMDDEDEEFGTTLAYTKSPKTAKRTSFQDELKKAINARVSRQQAIEDHEDSEYSEEFDSDDDSLDDSFEEKNETKSRFQKALHNFDFSDEEEDKPQKTLFLKSKTQSEKVKKEIDNNRISENKNSVNALLKSSLSQDGLKDKERADEIDVKPTPKPRETRIKSNIPENTEMMAASVESNRPIPQKRNLPRKSSHTVFGLSGQEEEIDKKTAPFSAPSSFIRLNETFPADEIRISSVGDSPETYKISKPPSPDLLYKFLPRSNGEKSVFTDESHIELEALPVEGNSALNSHGRGRKSPSVLDMMLASVNEKSLQEENEDHLQYTNEAGSKNEQMLHTIELSQEHNNQQTKGKMNESKKEEHLEKVRCPSSRSLNSLQTMKSCAKLNATKSLKSANSRYLGTLTVLDKSVKESGGDIEAADALRATVYQNWLQKKKMFFHDLHKMKNSEVEEEKEKHQKQEIAKKEEAKAAFEAWKSEKTLDIRKNLMKLKEEDQKKLEEIRDIAQKKQESKQAFEKWKEHKDVRLKEKSLKQKQTEKEKKNKEQKEIWEKKNDTITAINSWNEKKKHVLKEKQKEKKYEKVKEEHKHSEKVEQEKKAVEMYEQWLERKERRERIEKKQRRLQIALDKDPPPPWSPPGKTIPSTK